MAPVLLSVLNDVQQINLPVSHIPTSLEDVILIFGVVGAPRSFFDITNLLPYSV